MFKLRRPRAGVIPRTFDIDSLSTSASSRHKSKWTIGRNGSSCDVFLFANEQPNFLSRVHAIIKPTSMGSYTIEDNNSVNGLHVNNTKLTKGECHVLEDGDRVFFGDPGHSFFIEYEYCESRALNWSASLGSGDCASDEEISDGDTAVGSVCSGAETVVSKKRRRTSILEVMDGDSISNVQSFLPFSDVLRMRYGSKALHEQVIYYIECIKKLDWTKGIEALIPKCRHLQTVEASGSYRIDDSHLRLLAEYCTSTLRELNLSGCPAISLVGMESIAVRCTGLEVLKLRGCKRVAPEGSWDWLVTLVKRNANLKVLDLRGCNLSDTRFGHILYYAHKLEEVYIGVLPKAKLTDNAMKSIAVSKLKNLRHLDLCGCTGITDFGLFLLVSRCLRSLEYLSLQCCTSISNTSLKIIGQFCSNLKGINLHRCSSISSQGIIRLVHGLGVTLRSLDVSNCKIKDKALIAIAKYASNIRCIDLRGCREITSVGITELAQHCTDLEEIDVNGCHNLCDSGIEAIGKYCRNMKQIEAERCRRVSQEALLQLSADLPDALVYI